jgi:hypothetical protein
VRIDLLAMSSNISAFTNNISVTFFGNMWFIPAIPPRHEGRMRIVTKREAGCDGRELRTRRMRELRTAKSCGPGAPGLAPSLEMMIMIMISWRR